MTLIASTLQAFFTDRVASQSHASARTIAAYRDTLKLLLIFVHQRSGKPLWFPPNRGGLLYAASRSGAAVFS